MSTTMTLTPAQQHILHNLADPTGAYIFNPNDAPNKLITGHGRVYVRISYRTLSYLADWGLVKRTVHGARHNEFEISASGCRALAQCEARKSFKNSSITVKV